MATTSPSRRRPPLEPLYQIIAIDRETGRERIINVAIEKTGAQAVVRMFRQINKHGPKVVARRLRGIPDLTRNKPARDWALLIVSRPDGWAPSSRTDVPPTLRFICIESTHVDEGKARGMAIAFNLASMASNGHDWAIPMQIEGMPCAVRMGKGGAR